MRGGVAAHREVLRCHAHVAHEVEGRRLANVGHADKACVPGVIGGCAARAATGRGASLQARGGGPGHGGPGPWRPRARAARLWLRACRSLVANRERPQLYLPSHCSWGDPAARASPAPAKAEKGCAERKARGERRSAAAHRSLLRRHGATLPAAVERVLHHRVWCGGGRGVSYVCGHRTRASGLVRRGPPRTARF